MQRILFILLTFIAVVFSCDKRGERSEAAYKRSGNTAVVRMEGDADRLNPYLVTTNYGRMVVENLFMYLLTYDPFTLALQPDLAVARPKAEDITSGPYAGGVAYTFEILPEAVWDNGSPVTGYDYLFSLKAILNPLVQAAAVRAYLGDLAAVEVDPANPKKFRVTLREKTFLGEETVGGLFALLPEYAYDPKGLLKTIPLSDLTDPDRADQLAVQDERLQAFAETFNSDEYSRDAKKINGCGPYRVASWETEQRITLIKKQDWWGEKIKKTHPALTAYPDSLVYVPIPNPVAALTALKNEEIDAMGNIPAEDFKALQQDAAFQQRYALGTTHTLAYYYIGVNARDPLLSDKLVRQALSRAIDADEIVREVFQGFGKRIVAPVPPSVPYYPSREKPLTVDLEQAAALLRKAGWKDNDDDGIVDKTIDGKRVALRVKYMLNASSEQSKTIGLLIRSNCRKIGIDIELDPREPAMILERLKQRDFQLISTGRTQTPLWNPMQNWHTQGDNRCGFGDAATDALIEKILTTLDEATRNRLMGQLLARIREEQVEILLFSPEDRIAVHKRFAAELTPFPPGFTPSQFKLQE
jgi:peptide/nickel transport system substrate-binding protein